MENYLWPKRRVVVTGDRVSWAGRWWPEAGIQIGVAKVFVPRSAEYDFAEMAAVRQMYADARPDVVIHAAGVVGGIGANREESGHVLL